MEVVVEGSLFTRSNTTLSLILTMKKVGLTMHVEPVPMDAGGGGGVLVHQVHGHCVPSLIKVGLAVNWPAVHIERVPVDGGGCGGELVHQSTTTVSLILTLMKVGLTVNWPAMHVEPVPVDGGGGGRELFTRSTTTLSL
jgi:hypothetical protein